LGRGSDQVADEDADGEAPEPCPQWPPANDPPKPLNVPKGPKGQPGYAPSTQLVTRDCTSEVSVLASAAVILPLL
jgi:hypothetical protein